MLDTSLIGAKEERSMARILVGRTKGNIGTTGAVLAQDQSKWTENGDGTEVIRQRTRFIGASDHVGGALTGRGD